MKQVSLFICALLLQAAAFGQGKLVKKEKVLAKDVFKGSLYSSDIDAVKLSAKVWMEWKVVHAAEHGEFVKKGDSIIKFDRTNYDKALKTMTKNYSLAKLTYEKNVLSTEAAAQKLKQGRDIELMKFKAAETSKEMYLKKGMKLTKAEREQKVASAKLKLRYAEEELKQLSAMYKNDEVLEATEQLVMERQKYMVKSAKMALEKALYLDKLAQDGSYPQQDLMIKHKFENHSMSKKIAAVNFQVQKLSLDIKLAGFKSVFEKAEKSYKAFVEDGKLLDIKAKRDGKVVYGGLVKGKWLNMFGTKIKKDSKLLKGSVLMAHIGKSPMRVKVAVPFNKESVLKDKGSFVVYAGSEVKEAKLVSHSKGPVNGSFIAEFEIADATGLYEGIPCQVQSIRQKSDLILVAPTAIKRDPLKPWITYLNIIRNGKKMKVNVTFGETINGKKVIKSGLQVNDRVL